MEAGCLHKHLHWLYPALLGNYATCWICILLWESAHLDWFFFRLLTYCTLPWGSVGRMSWSSFEDAVLLACGWLGKFSANTAFYRCTKRSLTCVVLVFESSSLPQNWTCLSMWVYQFDHIIAYLCYHSNCKSFYDHRVQCSMCPTQLCPTGLLGGSYTVTEILCSFYAVHTFMLAWKQPELWGITWTETTQREMRTLNHQLKEGKDDSNTLIYQVNTERGRTQSIFLYYMQFCFEN